MRAIWPQPCARSAPHGLKNRRIRAELLGMDLTLVALAIAAWTLAGSVWAIGFFSLGFGFDVRHEGGGARRSTATTTSHPTRSPAASLSQGDFGRA